MTDFIGRHSGLPEKAYHADQALGNSSLRRLLKSPAHFMYGEPVETQATEDGTIYHAAILEPSTFAERFIWTTKYGVRRGTKEWQSVEEFGEGRHAIKLEQYERAMRIRDSIHQDPQIKAILKKFTAEVSYFADTGMGFRVKARFDIDDSEVPGFDFDLKKIVNMDRWEAHANDYGYNTAVFHYPFVKSLATGEPVKKMAFIAFEDKAPFLCNIFYPDDRVLQKGEEDARRAYEVYAECLRKNEWPKPRAKVTPYGLPKWVKWDD